MFEIFVWHQMIFCYIFLIDLYSISDCSWHKDDSWLNPFAKFCGFWNFHMKFLFDSFIYSKIFSKFKFINSGYLFFCIITQKFSCFFLKMQYIQRESAALYPQPVHDGQSLYHRLGQSYINRSWHCNAQSVGAGQKYIGIRRNKERSGFL